MSASGWFTNAGHKGGCTPNTPGCGCTDTMKCHQAIHPNWWPKKGYCRPDLSTYGSQFYPLTTCMGCTADNPDCTYGGPASRGIGTGSPAGCTSCKGDFFTYYSPNNKAYANYPARTCSSTCDCTACANKPVSSNCQGKDSKDGHACDCSFGNMKHGCWDDNCTGSNTTCDCTRCWNTPISARCKGVDSKIPGLQCECGLPDKNVCWNYNCCPRGTKAPGPTDAGPVPIGGTPSGGGGGGTVRTSTGTPSTRPTPAPAHTGAGDGGGSLPALSVDPNLILYGGAGLIALFIITGIMSKR